MSKILFFNRSPLQALTILKNLHAAHVTLASFEDKVKSRDYNLTPVEYSALAFIVAVSTGVQYPNIPTHSGVIIEERKSLTGVAQVITGTFPSGSLAMTNEVTALFPYNSMNFIDMMKSIVPTLAIRSTYDDGKELHMWSMRAADYLKNGYVVPEGCSMSADPNLAMFIAATRMLINLFTMIAHSPADSPSFVTANQNKYHAHSEAALEDLAKSMQKPSLTPIIALAKAIMPLKDVSALTNLNDTSYTDSPAEFGQVKDAQGLLDNLFISLGGPVSTGADRFK